MKHTPGPWSLETVRTSCGIVHKIGPFPWNEVKQNHACIYVDYHSVSGEREAELLANAHLMLAAPDMLAALTHARDYLRRPRFDPAMRDAVAAVLEAAIAKATGSTS